MHAPAIHRPHAADDPAPEILVVDPFAAYRAVILELLAEEHLSAVGVAYAAEALELVRQRRPRVAVVELSMPRRAGRGGMAGLQLVSALRQLDPPLPVILTSGAGGGELLLNYERLPVLEKESPVPLLEAIRAVL